MICRCCCTRSPGSLPECQASCLHTSRSVPGVPEAEGQIPSLIERYSIDHKETLRLRSQGSSARHRWQRRQQNLTPPGCHLRLCRFYRRRASYRLAADCFSASGKRLWPDQSAHQSSVPWQTQCDPMGPWVRHQTRG